MFLRISLHLVPPQSFYSPVVFMLLNIISKEKKILLHCISSQQNLSTRFCYVCSYWLDVKLKISGKLTVNVPRTLETASERVTIALPRSLFLFSFNCAIYSLWQLVPNMEHPFNKELLRGANKSAQTLRLTQRSAILRLHAVVGQRHKFVKLKKKKKQNSIGDKCLYFELISAAPLFKWIDFAKKKNSWV